MLEEYRKLVYKSEDEQKQVEQHNYEQCFVFYQYLSIDDYKGINDDNLPHELKSSYYYFNNLYESHYLFELTVERFGRKLWAGEAWKNNSCDRRCPFGNRCNKELFVYKGNNYCAGQIYIDVNKYFSNKIKHDGSFKDYLIIERSSPIIVPDGRWSYYFDIQLDSVVVPKSVRSYYFHKYELFIDEFGCKDSNGKINGRNVIPYLTS